MRKLDWFLVIWIFALAIVMLLQANEISSLREDLEAVKLAAMEIDYSVIIWINQAEEWIDQINEKISTLEKSYY